MEEGGEKRSTSVVSAGSDGPGEGFRSGASARINNGACQQPMQIHPLIHDPQSSRSRARRLRYVPTLAPSTSAPDALGSPETATGPAGPLPTDWQEYEESKRIRKSGKSEGGWRRRRAGGSRGRKGMETIRSICLTGP